MMRECLWKKLSIWNVKYQLEGCAPLDPRVIVGIFYLLSDASKVFHWLLQVLKFERTGNILVPHHFVKHSIPFTEIFIVTATLTLHL